MPTITDRVRPKDRFLPYDCQIAQSYSSRPVKITFPGPMTIANTVADDHYDDPRELNRALGDALNVEIRALAAAGCAHIQADEPYSHARPRKPWPTGSRTSSVASQACRQRCIGLSTPAVGIPVTSINRTRMFSRADPDAYSELVETIGPGSS